LRNAGLIVFFFSLILVNAARGQSTVVEPDIDGAVTQAFDLNATPLFSTTEKILNRGGDGVAVTLIHIIGQSTVSDQQIERICSILETAFRYPQLIVNLKDRTPDVSLLLLQSDKLRTNDPGVRNKVLSVRSHLMGLYKGSN
jgi:hypothetical protein